MTKHDRSETDPRSALVWVFVIAILCLYLFGLTIPLVGPDEPRYAQVAREMFERSDWITPTLGGFNWFEKPALLYWLEIASYNVFGVNEFAARFGSALFGLGTVISLWLVGRTVGDGGNKQFAGWLALLAATSIGLIVFSRAASFDIILTFPMTAAMSAFFIYDSRERSGSSGTSLPLLIFYFFVGMALLAKGLVGIVFPYSIVALYLLSTKRVPSKGFIASLIWGTLVALAVASIWYLPMYLRHGWIFIDEFFIQHHFQRYTSNKYFHPQPFYFFFWVLPLMTLPWLPFVFHGVWRSIKGLFQGQASNSERERPLVTFAFAWLLVPLVFFSFSGSKLPGYILPSLPPALIFAALSLQKFARSKARERVVLAIAGAMIVGVFLTLLFIVPKYASLDSTKTLFEAAERRGYGDLKVISMHHVSHNAEFYAAGRLVREPDGKQKTFLGPAEILAEIRREDGNKVLVIVPKEYLHQLAGIEYLRAEIIADNGESALVAVSDGQSSAALRNRSINALPMPVSLTVSQ